MTSTYLILLCQELDNDPELEIYTLLMDCILVHEYFNVQLDKGSARGGRAAAYSTMDHFVCKTLIIKCN